jgi:formate dehydrogenase assembly factor FdhD
VGKLKDNSKKIDIVKQDIKAKRKPSYHIGQLVTDTNKTTKLVSNAQNARERTNRERAAIIRKKIELLTPKNKIVRLNREEMDVYDLVLEYLIDEGFVDSEDAARNIMSVMSEEWKHSILLDWEIKQITPKQRTTNLANVRLR